MEKRNYQKEMEGIIKGLGLKVPSLLLHSCCAPCSSYVLESLSEYFEITVFYYNPNITKEAEYRYRTEEVKRLISELQVKHPIHFIEGPYEPDLFFKAVKGLEKEKEGGERCKVCFDLRLSEAAKIAKEGNFDYFTTSLTISPLKNAALLNTIGETCASKYDIHFLPSDFKKKNGYKRSLELSKEHDLYRQDYCGCIFSEVEAKERRNNNAGGL